MLSRFGSLAGMDDASSSGCDVKKLLNVLLDLSGYMGEENSGWVLRSHGRQAGLCTAITKNISFHRIVSG